LVQEVPANPEKPPPLAPSKRFPLCAEVSVNVLPFAIVKVADEAGGVTVTLFNVPLKVKFVNVGESADPNPRALRAVAAVARVTSCPNAPEVEFVPSANIPGAAEKATETQLINENEKTVPRRTFFIFFIFLLKAREEKVHSRSQTNL
jgi:hypothetical protein